MVRASLREGSGDQIVLAVRRWPVTSVMGLLEERETAARVRAEGLQAEADRILAELAEAEAVLERRVIARVELAEALAAPGAAAEASAQEGAPEPPAGAGEGCGCRVGRAAVARGDDGGGARAGLPADRGAAGGRTPR